MAVDGRRGRGDGDQAHPSQHVLRADKFRDEVVGRVGDDLKRRGELLHLALSQHHDPVGETHGLIDIMGNEQDRLLDLAVDTQEFFLKSVAGNGVERAKWLVHKHGRWLCRQRPRQANPLLLTAGELGGVAASIRLGGQPDQVEQLLNPPVDPRFLPFEQSGNRGDVVRYPHVREKPGLLDHISNLPAQLRRGQLMHLGLVDPDLPAGGFVDPVDHLQQRGLAAAGRPQKHDKLAGLDVQRDVVDSRMGAVRILLREVFEPDGAAALRIAFLLLPAHILPPNQPRVERISETNTRRGRPFAGPISLQFPWADTGSAPTHSHHRGV